MSPTGPYDPNRELVGQGLASVASGVFGGMPATGAIARTAVNVRSGARTRVAAIVHSLVLAHGGTVKVTTVPGQGCRFTVSLPRIADLPVRL